MNTPNYLIGSFLLSTTLVYSQIEFGRAGEDDSTVDANAWAETYPTSSTNDPWDTWNLNAPQPFETAASRRKELSLPKVNELISPRAIPIATAKFDQVSFEGNTVFSDEKLTSLIESYLHRPLDAEDLKHLANTITTAYISADYFNSGATIPEQDFSQSTLLVHIKEGKLSDLVLKGSNELNKHYLTPRLLGDQDAPLHFPTLAKRLQVLQTNPNINRINAELKPGSTKGEALLDVEIEENTDQWNGEINLNNYRSPSIGGYQLDYTITSPNLTGYSDYFYLRQGLFNGAIENLESAGLGYFVTTYSLPLFADDTSLELAVDRQNYAVLEEPFEDLDIEGESMRYSLGLSRPFYRTLNHSLTLRLDLDHRHSETSLLGEPFSISPGFVDGELDLTAVRLSAYWLSRLPNQVFAAQTTIASGIPALSHTSEMDPDASFVSWRLNTQYLRRLNEQNHLFVVRNGLQLSSSPLIPAEKISFGGHQTVRGYRENTIIRDNGAFLNLEYHYPILTEKISDKWHLNLIPFVDSAVGWNHDSIDTEYLVSAGLELEFRYKNLLETTISWGSQFTNLSRERSDLQDNGISFELTFRPF